jgi:hypothetical protein
MPLNLLTEKTVDKALWKALAISTIFLAVALLALISMQTNTLNTCREEAKAWYNATVTQADEFYYWMDRGQQPGELDFGVSHIFIAKGHELNCIQTKLPTG